MPLKQMLFRRVLLSAVGRRRGRRLRVASRAPDRAAPRAKPQAAALPEVTVAEVIHRPLREWQEFSGRLQAVNTVEIRPRVSGYIDRVAFEDGARVTKGQLLFQIDPRPFQAEVDRLLAERSRSLSDLELAKANRARAERLIGAHAISREDYERLVASEASAQGALGLDRCVPARSAPQSRIHRGARTDRRPRVARDHHRRKSRDERQSVDDARLR